MFNILDRYVTINFFVAMGFFILALAGMFWLGQSMVLIDEIVLRGESALSFFQISTKLLPKIFLNVTPVAALAAALFAMNSMATRSELVVMEATGRRPLRMALPIALIGVLITAFLYSLSFYLAPKSSFGLRLSLQKIEEDYSSNVILSGRFIFPVDKVTVFAGDSLLSGEMTNLFIEDRRVDNLVRTYFAERGLYAREGDVMQFALINGEFHERNLQTEAVSRAYFERTEITMENPFDNPKTLVPWRDQLSMPKLYEDFQNAEADRKSYYIAEYANRIFYPLLGFVLPVLAVIMFLNAKYSRHGYGRPIFGATVAGLSIMAFQMALPSIVEGNPALIWLGFFPLLIVLVSYYSSYFRGR